MHALEAASPRVSAATYGTTPEGRELLRVVVSSPENLARLDAIAAGLKSLGDPQGTSREAARAVVERSPAVVWIACGIHGNETAGPEACAALLYTLAASRESGIEELLSSLVVVVDPCANPDGHERHVSWWRSVAGDEPDPDPHALENEPPWPSGRTNHFGVDLNRDWAWATQPETRARLAALRALPPQVYVDIHEMGPDQSYFFPPPAEPVHPRVPETTRKWIETFGKANAEAFDARGWSFFNRETFDLFYPAYGDSWPSFRGMVGMTYEVGGKGGLAHRRKDGVVVTLKERALKHWTALSATLRTAAANRAGLLADYEALLPHGTRGGRGASSSFPAARTEPASLPSPPSSSSRTSRSRSRPVRSRTSRRRGRRSRPARSSSTPPSPRDASPRSSSSRRRPSRRGSSRRSVAASSSRRTSASTT